MPGPAQRTWESTRGLLATKTEEEAPDEGLAFVQRQLTHPPPQPGCESQNPGTREQSLEVI